MFNANGGPGGRQVKLNRLDLAENDSAFLPSLAAGMERPGVIAAIGGSSLVKGPEIAEYMRRANYPWLGPWSNQMSIYQGTESDPFAVLPGWDLEIAALLKYAAVFYKAEAVKRGSVAFVYHDLPDTREMAEFAAKKAQSEGLVLKTMPIPAGFSSWADLAARAQGIDVWLIWLDPGTSAALAKAIKTRRPEALLLTSSLNATNRNLVAVSGGAWNGVVFPAVVRPSASIDKAYADLLRKYGPVGLDDSYQAYLGFAQGQILAQALNSGSVATGLDLRRALYGIKGLRTLLWAPVTYSADQKSGNEHFYLGRAVGDGKWEPAIGQKLDWQE